MGCHWISCYAVPPSVRGRGSRRPCRPHLRSRSWRNRSGRCARRCARRCSMPSRRATRRRCSRRWPQLHITPAYAWGGDGIREDARGALDTESALGVSFELPLFNRHQGPIAEALARRTAAGEHLKAVQAQIFEQIERAEQAWPAVREAWQETGELAALAERRG